MPLPGRQLTPASGNYRYGFNGKEKDNELKGDGNSYNFGMRIYNPRVGKWLSKDPKFQKYPHFSPYCAFANNPNYYIDPEGDTLRVAGNISQAKSDVIASVDKKYQAWISFDNDRVIVNLTEKQVEEANDPGLTALYYLSNSDKKYLYEVNSNKAVNISPTELPNQNGVYSTTGRKPGSKGSPQGRQEFEYTTRKVVGTRYNGKPKKRKVTMVTLIDKYVEPEDGYDASIVVHDTDWETIGATGDSQTRASMSFHELYEMYEMEEKNPGTARYPYAHENTEIATETLPENDERKKDGPIQGIKITTP
jgi:RHS repeat-associated protein